MCHDAVALGIPSLRTNCATYDYCSSEAFKSARGGVRERKELVEDHASLPWDTAAEVSGVANECPPHPPLRRLSHQKTNKSIPNCHSYANLPQAKAVLTEVHPNINSRMQPTLHATRSTPHGASRLVQANVCLVSENPPCSVPVL